MPSMIERLKENRVVQWALGYLAGAFVALQVMDALEGPLGLSQRTEQSVVALLATGFVVCLIVAWFHGREGEQRVTVPEILAVGVTLAIGLSVTAVIFVGGGDAPALGSTGQPVAEVVPVDSSDFGSIETDGTSDSVAAPGEGADLTPAGQPAPIQPPSTPARSTAPTRQPTPTVTPTNPTIFMGDSVRLALDTERPVQWSSLDRSVAMVMSDGLVLAVGAGSTRIVASVDGVDVSSQVTVRRVAVSRLELAPIGTMRVGQSVTPNVRVVLTDGESRADATPAWTSSEPTVVRVSSAGVVTAVAQGSARISAEVDGAVESIDVSVEAREPEASSERPVSNEVLFAALERYRVALGNRSVPDVLAAYPGLTAEERAGWEALFRLGALTVQFSGLAVQNADASTAVVEFQQRLTGARIETNTTRFSASLSLGDGVWRIAQLRSLTRD